MVRLFDTTVANVRLLYEMSMETYCLILQMNHHRSLRRRIEALPEEVREAVVVTTYPVEEEK